MESRHQDNLHLIRLDPGDKIIASIVQYIENKRDEFPSGFFTGIGATSSCEIGWFDLGDEEYKNRLIDENCEIISLVGNIAWLGDKPVVHAHISLGRKDYSIAAGHLIEGTISITCEIWLQKAPFDVRRKPSIFKNLKLINFEE
jgi:uncharacterized protein